jgi:hypothetical protein
MALSGLRATLFCSIAAVAGLQAYAQVSPDEIVESNLRAAEQRYLPELTSLNRAIGAKSFPMSFRLARYIKANSGRAALDGHGIEFVSFHNRVILKISGIYGDSFDLNQLNENSRAIRVFEGAVVPMLQILAKNLPRSIACDGIGFELIYGTRDPGREFDLQGREVFSLVLSRDDAFAIADATDQRSWQKIFDRSDVYVSGQSVVLRLDPSQDPDRKADATPEFAMAAEPSFPGRATATAPVSDSVEGNSAAGLPANSKTQQAVRLQQQFGTQAKAVLDAENTKLHPDPVMTPQFENEAEQIRLHVTFRNSLPFEERTSSIYKRAARSFDQFLAPELKTVVKMLPAIESLDAFHFSVLNTVTDSSNSLEVVDYICPVDALRSFVNNQITSQQLIDQSTVLVNGVRIGINLQLVE